MDDMEQLTIVPKKYQEFMNSDDTLLPDRIKRDLKNPTMEALFNTYASYVITAVELDKERESCRIQAHNLVGTGVNGLLAQIEWEKSTRAYSQFDKEQFNELNKHLFGVFMKKKNKLECKEKLNKSENAFLSLMEKYSDICLFDLSSMYQVLHDAQKACPDLKISLNVR